MTTTATFTLEPVRLVRDTDGAWCPTCGLYADDLTTQAVPWGWRNTRWLHEHGTGHTMTLVRRVWPNA